MSDLEGVTIEESKGALLENMNKVFAVGVALGALGFYDGKIDEKDFPVFMLGMGQILKECSDQLNDIWNNFAEISFEPKVDKA